MYKVHKFKNKKKMMDLHKQAKRLKNLNNKRFKNNNKLKLDRFTNISYFNSTILFDNDKLNIKELSKFVPNFKYFIKLKDPKKPIVNTLYLKYIR